jgi:hypothetical protein
MSTTTIFVGSMHGGRVKWSRYTFAFVLDDWTQLDNDLYIRAGDTVYVVDPEMATDAGTEFLGRAQWGWLDLGAPGRDKNLEGFDFVGSGQPSISFGYDQRDTTLFTDAYAIDADTLVGGMIGYELVAPTFSVRLDFAGGEAWSVDQVGLYFIPTGGR